MNVVSSIKFIWNDRKLDFSTADSIYTAFGVNRFDVDGYDAPKELKDQPIIAIIHNDQDIIMLSNSKVMVKFYGCKILSTEAYK